MIIDIGNLRIILEIPYKSLIVLIILILLTIISYRVMIELRKKRYIHFGNFYTLKKVEGEKKFRISYLVLLSKLLVITLLFLVATHSLEINLLNPVSDTDFVFALDSSPSMLYEDYPPNRLSFVKNESLKWLSVLPSSSKVGVISFSDKVFRECNLTTNFKEIKEAILRIKVNETSSGTAIGTALAYSSAILKSSSRKRAIILITDGDNNAGIPIKQALFELKNNNVTVYIIGISNNNRTSEIFEKWKLLIEKSKEIPLKEKSKFMKKYALPKLNTTLLANISSYTGGDFYKIEDSKDLDKAFSKILILNNRIPLDSAYYILLLISFLLILEFLLYSKYGAL